MIDLPEASPDLTRVRVMFVLIVLGLATIIGRLWYLQIARGDELREASLNNERRLIRRLPPRGLIEDRNGKVLASNREKITVSVVPYEIRKNPDVLPRLAALIGKPLDDLHALIDPQYKNNAFDSVLVDDDVSIETVTRLEEQKLDLPGVYIGPEPVRYYPDKEMCGHLLGQMGQITADELKKGREAGYRPGDFSGKLGLEREYDNLLRGQDGGREVEVDARGRMRREVGATDPVAGDTLTLNIDKELERIAYDELVARHKAGAAVAMDPETGAVLALVSYPSYDPNEFVNGVSRAYLKELNKDPLKPQINRAVYSGNAPGSTFKLVVSAAGLDTGKVTASSTDYCSGAITLGRWVKHCDKRSGHGSLNLIEAIAQSCDIYYYHLGERLGPEVMAEYARKFGLGSKSGIDLPFVDKAGHVPNPAKRPLSAGEVMDMGIGQSTLLCTPIQLCRMVSAIANGGTLYEPQLVKTITQYEAGGGTKVVHRMEPRAQGQVGISEKALATVREGMIQVMTNGTGAGNQIPGVTMAGKTGTAQRFHHEDNAWFVGFAPVEHPRIAVCCFVEEGGFGASAAAPIARKMIARYLKIKLPEEKAAEEAAAKAKAQDALDAARDAARRKKAR